MEVKGSVCYLQRLCMRVRFVAKATQSTMEHSAILLLFRGILTWRRGHSTTTSIYQGLLMRSRMRIQSLIQGKKSSQETAIFNTALYSSNGIHSGWRKHLENWLKWILVGTRCERNLLRKWLAGKFQEEQNNFWSLMPTTGSCDWTTNNKTVKTSPCWSESCHSNLVPCYKCWISNYWPFVWSI